MAISFDASSGYANTSASEASFSWSHGAGASPEGVLIFTFTLAEPTVSPYYLNGDNATSVTYGGVTVDPVSGGRAEVINTQSGFETDCKAWFLGSGLPTGTQTVVVNRTNNALKMWAVAVTFNSSQNSAVHSSLVLFDGEPASISEASVTDGSSGTGDSMRAAGIICENSNFSTFLDDPITLDTLYPGGNSTYRHGRDFGNLVAMVVTETTAGTGSRSVGFTGDTSYRSAVHLAVKDVSGSLTVVKDLIGRGIIPFKR
jgi:hypothetical protein